jgi:DNA-binding transcriptional regulator YiaG
MTSNSTPEPKAAPQSPSTTESRASSSDAPEAESTSKSKAKSKPTATATKSSKSKSKARAGTEANNVRKLRQAAMMSKAELARRAGVSPLTIDRVEAGCPCRMDTKRKILEALGLSPSARAEVWPGIDEQS